MVFGFLVQEEIPLHFVTDFYTVDYTVVDTKLEGLFVFLFEFNTYMYLTLLFSDVKNYNSLQLYNYLWI